MDIQYHNDPWEYVVVDNFFPEDIYQDIVNSKEDFEELSSLIFDNDSQCNLYCENTDEFKILGRIKKIRKKGVKNYRTQTQNLVKLFPELCESYKRWHSHLNDSDELKEIYKKLNHKVDIEKTNLISGFQCHQKNYKYHIHDESETKMLSVVVYIGPEENNGTQLYTSKDQDYDAPTKVIEWKPNRAFIFSGKKGLTWHAYSANNKVNYRRTFAAFFHTDKNLEENK